jgi:hypothetical protein
VGHVRPPDDDPRTDGGFKGERATLVGFLRDQRLTLELKCSGSGRRRPGPPVGGAVQPEVLVHMIEEYARHNGHADFLRERIDGRVGQ